MTSSKFKVGDQVDYTNDQGVIFNERTVTEIDSDGGEFFYHVTPTDCPWVTKPERNLSLAA